MSKKGKKPQPVTLADFQGKDATACESVTNDWAADTPEEIEAARAAGGGNIRQTVNKVVGDKISGFRDSAVVVPGMVGAEVPKDMPPPYIAFVGSIPTALPENEVRSIFDPPNKILNIKVTTQEKSTFAFIEFGSIEHLQAALNMTGKTVRNRQIKVDIASDGQKANMEKFTQSRRGGGIGDRVGSSGGLANLDRECMGVAQPPRMSMDRRQESGSDLSRSLTSGMSSRMGSHPDLSRDMMGMDSVTPLQMCSPNTPSNKSSSEGMFSNGKSGEFGSGYNFREGGGGAVGSGASLGGGRWGSGRGSNNNTPKTFKAPDFTNWRDTPVEVAPSKVLSPTYEGGRGRGSRDRSDGLSSEGGRGMRKGSSVTSWRDGPDAEVVTPNGGPPKRVKSPVTSTNTTVAITVKGIQKAPPKADWGSLFKD